MSDLAAVTKQHVQLAVREGLEVTLVERFSSHSAIPVLYRVGGKMPLHCTGMGLALLAFAPVEVQEEVLSRPLHGEPDQNLIPPTVMRRTLAEVRRERLAIYRRMDPEPLVAVAAPIFGEHEEAVAAIGVLLPERIAQPRRLGYALRTAAQSISRQLGTPSGLDARHGAAPDGRGPAAEFHLLTGPGRQWMLHTCGQRTSEYRMVLLLSDDSAARHPGSATVPGLPVIPAGTRSVSAIRSRASPTGPIEAGRLRNPCSIEATMTCRTSAPAAASAAANAWPDARRSSYSALSTSVGHIPRRSASAGKA